jgi:hypothetical protein
MLHCCCRRDINRLLRLCFGNLFFKIIADGSIFNGTEEPNDDYDDMRADAHFDQVGLTRDAYKHGKYKLSAYN